MTTQREWTERMFMEEQGAVFYRMFIGEYEAVLYWMDAQELNDNRCFTQSYQMLSPDRRRKVDSYLRMKDKKMSLAAGLLMDCGLSAYGLREREVVTACGKNGKPYLPGEPHIHFNLSHSENMALAVFAGTETGCDIEKIQEADMALAEKFLHPGEYAYIARQPKGIQRNEAFYRIWTLKESFVKSVGAGIMLPFHFFEMCILPGDRIAVRQKVDCAAYTFREYRIGGYCAAVCFREGKQPAQI